MGLAAGAERRRPGPPEEERSEAWDRPCPLAPATVTAAGLLQAAPSPAAFVLPLEGLHFLRLTTLLSPVAEPLLPRGPQSPGSRDHCPAFASFPNKALAGRTRTRWRWGSQAGSLPRQRAVRRCPKGKARKMSGVGTAWSGPQAPRAGESCCRACAGHLQGHPCWSGPMTRASGGFPRRRPWPQLHPSGTWRGPFRLLAGSPTVA